MTFVYDAEASKNRVTTHASGGKNREMTAQEYAAYAHDRDKVQAAVKALEALQEMDPYKRFFGKDLGTAISDVKHQLESFIIPRAWIDIKPDQGPIFK